MGWNRGEDNLRRRCDVTTVDSNPGRKVVLAGSWLAKSWEATRCAKAAEDEVLAPVK